MIDKKIGIIGCGNMGSALIGGLSKVMEKSVSLMVSETDTARRDAVQKRYRLIVEIDNNRLVKFSDVIIIAVKPQDIEDVLRHEICCGASGDKVLISIAAGITTSYIEKIVGEDVPVIRVMPNMAASIGQSVSGMCAGKSAKAEQMKLAKEIFSTIGEVFEVKEDLMDAVTAVSGSGPAYFFYLIEALIEAACDLGLDKVKAKEMVIGTALGSTELLKALKEEPSELRRRVTSRGGTTEAAIKVFESKKVKDIVKKAINEACKRSKRLRGG